MKLHLAFCSCLFFVLSACYYDKAEELYPNNYNQTDTSAATYAAHIAPLINTKCMNCHNTTAPILGDYSKLKIIIDNGSFNNRVMVQKNMPPSGLSISELSKIQKWLNAGALNN